MRIDPIQSSIVAAGTAQAHSSADPIPASHPHEAEPAASTIKTPIAMSMSEHEVSVQLDDSLHRIYRFVDKRTGDLIQQVPPEELLRVMRNISEMLERSGEHLKVNG